MTDDLIARLREQSAPEIPALIFTGWASDRTPLVTVVSNDLKPGTLLYEAQRPISQREAYQRGYDQGHKDALDALGNAVSDNPIGHNRPVSPNAEPVAWAYVNTDGECEQIEWGLDEGRVPDECIPLYTIPPATFTREQIMACVPDGKVAFQPPGDEDYLAMGWNHCRAEMLRRIEEMTQGNPS